MDYVYFFILYNYKRCLIAYLTAETNPGKHDS